jgi:hypothetical protein
LALWLLFVGLAGCAQSSAKPEEKVDLAAGGVCPAHPDQCGGKCCGDACAEIKLDVRNCGDCGVQCATGQVCYDGRCGCPPMGTSCGMGQSCCGVAGCKSLDSDINNCGACGNSCGVGPGSKCVMGKCTCGDHACPGTQKCCSGTCMDQCVPPPPDMAAAACVCPSKCPLSKTCVGNGCCFEDLVVPNRCTDKTPCSQVQYP